MAAQPQAKTSSDAYLLRQAAHCRRAIPRDLLTGAPISADAIVRRVRVYNPPDRASAPEHRGRPQRASVYLPTLAYSEDEGEGADDE